MTLYDNLKECLTAEVLKSRNKFSWFRVIRRCLSEPKKRYLFWWRIANYLYLKGGKINKKLSAKINRKLIIKYNTEIELGTKIGIGLYIGHHGGIVISNKSIIGNNFTIRQCTTIGIKEENGKFIQIGDNVNIGAHTCIISDGLTIGDNVTIGAMSFINKDIPSDVTVYTEKTNRIISKA